MSLKDLCLQRQSCRNYMDRPVEAEKLEYVLECARLAPSAVNRQPWKIHVLKSEAAKAKAVACYNRDWAKTAPMFLLLTIQHPQEWVRPCDGKPHGMIDIAIIAEHICLAATEVGLGTCWVCNFDYAKMTELFAFAEGEEPAVLIPIGYGCDPYREKSRKALDEFVDTL